MRGLEPLLQPTPSLPTVQQEAKTVAAGLYQGFQLNDPGRGAHTSREGLCPLQGLLCYFRGIP